MSAVLACVHRTALIDLQRQADTFLHPAEQARWASFPAAERRDSFLMGRYAAKRALRLLRPDIAPNAIRIAPGILNQPVVHVAMTNPPAITLSHSTEVAIAAAYERENVIGVDVEDVASDCLEVIATAATPREWTAATAVVGDTAVTATVLWCLKEALSKALRCGLTTPFELLATAELDEAVDGCGGWVCAFPWFAQFRGRAWNLDGQVVALAYPHLLSPQLEPDTVQRLHAVVTGGASVGEHPAPLLVEDARRPAQ